MPRAAGSDPFYTFELRGRPEVVLRFDSVTSVIKGVMGAGPHVVNWAYKRGVEGETSPKEFRDMRAAEGTAAHEYLERRVAGETLDPADGYQEAIENWLGDGFEEFIVGSEQILYSLEHRFAGTCDLVLDLPDEPGLTIVDLKTRDEKKYKAYESDLIQVSAYALAYEEMNPGVMVGSTGVLIAKPNGKTSYDDRYVDEQIFLNLLDTYRLLKGEKLL